MFITGKGKVCPTAGHEGPDGEYRYSSTLSLTSALDEGGWLTARHGRFTPGKETRYPLYRRLGGPQGRSGRVRKIFPPPGFFFSLCTSSVLFCPVCPCFAFCPYCTTNTTQTSMPLAGFEPAISAGERLQTHALDRSATGNGIRSPDRPSGSESLYRLSYPSPVRFPVGTTIRSFLVSVRLSEAHPASSTMATGALPRE